MGEWQQLPHQTVGAAEPPTGRMRSSGCFLKSVVAGGFYPPLQGGYAHPGACEYPGLRADSIRPYRACARRFLSGTLPGGSGNQWIRTSLVAALKFAPRQMHPGAININSRTETAPVRRSTAAAPDSTGTGCRRASRRTGSRRSCPPDGDRPCRRFPCG